MEPENSGRLVIKNKFQLLFKCLLLGKSLHRFVSGSTVPCLPTLMRVGSSEMDARVSSETELESEPFN